MSKDEKKEALAPDPYMLDEELMLQPTLFDSAQESAAEWLRMRDTAKDDLEKIEAETLLRVHSDPESFGFEKVTGDIAKAAVATDENVIRAKRLLVTMQENLAKANGYVKAVDTKKKSLEGLIQLYNGNYFSLPNQGKEIDGGKRFAHVPLDKQRQRLRQTDEEREEDRKKTRGKLSNDGVKESFDKAADAEDKQDGRRRGNRTQTPSGRRGSRRRKDK